MPNKTSAPRSADMMVDIIMHTPGTLERLKGDPEQVLRQTATIATRELLPPAIKTDRWLWRSVVWALGAVALCAVLGAIYLVADASSEASRPVPDILTALGSAAIGALAGLLAPSPTAE